MLISIVAQLTYTHQVATKHAPSAMSLLRGAEVYLAPSTLPSLSGPWRDGTNGKDRKGEEDRKGKDYRAVKVSQQAGAKPYRCIGWDHAGEKINGTVPFAAAPQY